MHEWICPKCNRINKDDYGQNACRQCGRVIVFYPGCVFIDQGWSIDEPN